jgi:hypothetical protein
MLFRRRHIPDRAVSTTLRWCKGPSKHCRARAGTIPGAGFLDTGQGLTGFLICIETVHENNGHSHCQCLVLSQGDIDKVWAGLGSQQSFGLGHAHTGSQAAVQFDGNGLFKGFLTGKLISLTRQVRKFSQGGDRKDIDLQASWHVAGQAFFGSNARNFQSHCP